MGSELFLLLCVMLIGPHHCQLSNGQTSNQRILDLAKRISTPLSRVTVKSILPQARYCPVMKAIENNELYDKLHLYNAPNTFRKLQVCPGDVDVIQQQFPTAPSPTYSDIPAYGKVVGNIAPTYTYGTQQQQQQQQQQGNRNPDPIVSVPNIFGNGFPNLFNGAFNPWSMPPFGR